MSATLILEILIQISENNYIDFLDKYLVTVKMLILFQIPRCGPECDEFINVKMSIMSVYYVETISSLREKEVINVVRLKTVGFGIQVRFL